MTINPWIEIRNELFTLMEERRPKAALFRLDQIYFFITRCSKLFGSPGSQEAQDALGAIQDDGSFLLVSDSLGAFLGIFAGGEAADSPPQPTHKPAEPVSSRVGRAVPEPDLRRPTTQVSDQPVTPRSQPSSSARATSGRSFRSDQT